MRTLSAFCVVLGALASCEPSTPTASDPPADPSQAVPPDTTPEPKEATAATRDANAALLNELAFTDRADFDAATRGFVATWKEPAIRNEKGDVVWDFERFAFLKGKEAPDTVNPSLWRQAQLLAEHGLFEVAPDIYQVRGFDLANMTIIRTKSSWIVIDPLGSAETARAALQIANEHLGERPISAVVYTHSHIDHFGGVKGIVDEAAVKAGKVRIYAPEHFTEHAVSENVMAGNVMSRRASYMYGALLPWDAKGSVGSGLGLAASTGTITLIEPTHLVKKTGERATVDGITMVFQMAPASEAPAEMMIHFPQLRAFCAAENINHTLHNLYTLRGAQVRDARLWSGYIDEAITLFGADTDLMFASHHWPTWGHDDVIDMMKKQRDVYKYIHDQALRLANQGYTMTEIAEQLELPNSLTKEFYNRSYYGTVSHDAKAVYQRYLGWFDGNPAHLEPLPPGDAAKKYVAYMGGSAAVLEKAKNDYAAGDYRWVAEALNHVVFAEPDNTEARNLLADTYEQLGYQAESGPWRGFYLTGAKELRHGVQEMAAPSTNSPDLVRGMSTEMFFEHLATRVNGPKAAKKNIVLDLTFTDTNERWRVSLENGVLRHARGGGDIQADAAIKMTRAGLDDISLGVATAAQQLESGAMTLTGQSKALEDLVATLDRFEFWFPIATPRDTTPAVAMP